MSQAPDISDSGLAAGRVEPMGERQPQLGERHLELGPAVDLLDVPGVMQEFVEWTLATARRPQPLFALGGALAAVGVLTARRYESTGGARGNLFMIALAESGHGKDASGLLNLAIKNQEVGTWNRGFILQRDSAVTMKPPCSSQRYHWGAAADQFPPKDC